MTETTYAERVGDQVTKLIETHEILMHSDAEMAARKVRHALQNYLQQVDHVLGEQDGGRRPRTFRQTKDHDEKQTDLEEQIRQENAEKEAHENEEREAEAEHDERMRQERLERENQDEAVDG